MGNFVYKTLIHVADETESIIYLAKRLFFNQKVDSLTEHGRVSPLKVGLLIVALSYFLFNAHTLFTLQWVGEWNRFGGFSLAVFLEDITSFVGVIFRFIAGIIAVGSVIFYFSKGLPSTQKTYRILKLILVFEAIYWITLIPTAGVNVYYIPLFLHRLSTLDSLNYILLTTIPSIIEAIAVPAALIVLTTKLSPNKPLKSPIKWGLITGTLYITVFWLVNTSMWIGVINAKGIDYLWVEVTKLNGINHVMPHPEHLVSFIITAFGLLALAIYSGYLTKKSVRVESIHDLKLGAVGAIILALGTYFLWNYFSWAIFGGNTWNDWYAWFLGHNMDLWMLSLPLLGLPLLFYIKPPKQTAETANKNA